LYEFDLNYQLIIRHLLHILCITLYV